RQMQEQFPERDDDPLLGPGAPPITPARPRREPVFGSAEASRVADAAPASDTDDDPAEVDPTTEVVIDIAFAQPVPSEQLHAATHNIKRAGSKPVRMFAEKEGGGH